MIGGWSAGSAPSTPLDPLFLLLWFAGCAGALGAAANTKYHRFAALIMVGVAGLATCLTFAWFSAPDLALTQLVVETVTLILILLGLRWLPRRLANADSRRTTYQARLRRSRDFAIAVLVGAGVSRGFLFRAHPPGEQAKSATSMSATRSSSAVAATW